MSHFISSFIVEPVVRQVHRFSHSSVNTGPATGEQYRSQFGSGQLHSVQTLASPHGNGPVIFNNSNDDILQDQIILDQPVVSSPISEDGGLDDELEALQQSRSSSLDQLRGNNASHHRDAYTARRSISSRVVDDTFNSPIHRIAGRFRSANGSNGSSINSATDSDMTPVEGSVLSRRQTGQVDSRGGASSYSSKMGHGPLPEDDGMGILRKRIIDIQSKETSNADKSRLIHELMTEQYNSSQSSLHNPHQNRARSPASLRSQERPFTPSSGPSVFDFVITSPPTSMSPTVDEEDVSYLTSEDLEPTYYTKSSGPQEAENTTPPNGILNVLEDEERPLGCAHYQRNVKLQCSDCDSWYTCRFCHDEVEDHSLNRRETKNMLCMFCGCDQPASEECIDCGEISARYYCSICKLWDNDPEKKIYHCDECGICRVGQGLGKDFYHCKTCMVCLDISIRDTHRCIERSTDCDCPICGQYMFTSPQTVVFMRCGHSIHQSCYWQHSKTSYRCPICSKSMLNMENSFRQLDRAIEDQPMPSQFQDTKAWVYCNDCCAKTSVRYHWLGLKCAICDSYNTVQIRLLSGPEVNPEATDSEEIVDTLVPEDIDLLRADALQQSVTRGRAFHHSELPRRSVSSAMTSEDMRTPTYQASRLQHRTHRSLSPVATRLPFEELASNPSFEPDPMDTDSEDLEDVDFWGRISSKEKARQEHEGAKSVDDSENIGDEDDEDELMDDENDEDRYQDDDEAEEVDHMELFGHR